MCETHLVLPDIDLRITLSRKSLLTLKRIVDEVLLPDYPEDLKSTNEVD